jgi:hypothetical protein
MKTQSYGRKKVACEVTVVAVKIPVFRDMTPCDWYISYIVEELSPSFVRVPVQYHLKILEISSIFNLGIGMR